LKIAFCISGELRTFLTEDVLSSYKSICEKLSPDIFVSIWDHVGVSNCHRDNLQIDYSEKVNVSDIKNSLQNIIKIDVENYSSWRGELPDEFSNIINRSDMDYRTKNSCSQLYKIFKCNELKKQHEIENNFVYDIVIRLRPDFLFQNCFSLDIDQNTIYHINSDVAFYPNRIYDVLFYGDSSSMDKITSAYKYFQSLVYDSFSNGLDQRDCCRILKVLCNRENLKVFDGPVLGDIFRR